VSQTTAAGTTTASASGLDALTTYYFSIRAIDQAGNISQASVETSGSTDPAGIVDSPVFAPAGGLYGTTQNVAITTSSSSSFAAICYSNGGTSPECDFSSGCATGTLYSMPVSVTASQNLTAIACASGYSASSVSSAVYTIDTTGPTAPGNLTATTFSASQIDLTWSASTDNISSQMNLVYQVCKSTATNGCTDASFAVLATTGAGVTSYSVTGLSPVTQYFFKVRAVDEMGNFGLVSNVSTTTTGQFPNVPQFNYAAGTYYQTLVVAISSNSLIYYTKDGSTPNCTGNGALYQQPYTVSITTTTTLQAISCQSAMVYSNVASATYTLQAPPAPQFSVSSGTYSTNQSVAITTPSAGAIFFYTTDGMTTPDCAGAGILYIQPLVIKTTTTLAAIACGGTLISAVSTAAYTITSQPITTQMGGSIQLTEGNTLSLFGAVTTYAGKSNSAADGVSSSAGFNNPLGSTTDGTNLYVADTYNHTIRKVVISSGVVTTLAGTAGSWGSTDDTGNAARFYNPMGITTDGSNLYVADTYNRTIRKVVISSGVVTTLAGTASVSGSTDGAESAARFYSPYGITTDGMNLFVADRSNHTIRKIVISSGVVTTLAGTAGSSGATDDMGTAASFYNPYGITTDGMNLFVADWSNHTIRKIVISSGVVTTLAGTAGSLGSTDDTGTAARFIYPRGITTDGTNLYVADTSNHTIRKIVISSGMVTTLAGTAGSSGSIDGTGNAARFYSPSGITTDGTNLYVADTSNHTIRKIVISSGVVTTLAGTSGSSGSTDGTGNAARFYFPRGITTDGTNLYAADAGNNIIRKIVISTGVVTTLAGTAGISGSTDATGTAARFNNPQGITSDGLNLFVADSSNSNIRRIE
jgi:sugar lactone lactonase YvrE